MLVASRNAELDSCLLLLIVNKRSSYNFHVDCCFYQNIEMPKRTRDQISDSEDGEEAVGSDKELNMKSSIKRRKHTSDESNNSDDSDSSLRENRRENVKSNLFLEDLSSDDELLTIQIPSGFSAETLTNIKIDFNEVNQIKDKSGDVFNVRFLENQSKIVFALPSKKKNAGLKAVPLGGHIIIHKDVNIPDVNFNNDRDNDNDKIDFPTDLKVRHPLLGADWKDYIGKTNEELKERSPKKRRKVKA